MINAPRISRVLDTKAAEAAGQDAAALKRTARQAEADAVKRARLEDRSPTRTAGQMLDAGVAQELFASLRTAISTLRDPPRAKLCECAAQARQTRGNQTPMRSGMGSAQALC